MRGTPIRLLLVALLAAGATRAADAAELTIGTGSASAGGSASIDLVLSLQPTDAIAALSLELGFDASQLVDPPVCTIHPSIGPGTTADKSLSQSQPSPGVARLGIFGLNNEQIPAGTVATCSFTAKPTAAAGSYLLSGLAGASSPSGASVAITAAAGGISIAGDGDGIDVIAGMPPCAPGQTTNCSDNCPNVANPGQEDADADGVGDACDLCVAQADPGQADTDGDGYGNACDCDFNQDGSCGIGDFNDFLVDFSATTDSGKGTDMNADGSVGILDFQLFLDGFAASVPGPSALHP